MAQTLRSASIGLRNRSVPSQERMAGITDASNQAGDAQNSQGAQTPQSGEGATPTDTLGEDCDRNNNAPIDAPIDSRHAGDDPRLAGLTPTQRYTLLVLQAEREVAIEKRRLAELESLRVHRREHSDDHYRDASRKRASVTRVPDTQHLSNFNSTMTFICDCEDYIASAPRNDFRTDAEKTRWSSSILADAKKQTWRNAREALLLSTGEPTWKQYTEWCLDQVRNPAVKTHDIGRQLARATMRDTQTVSSFNDYLASLWVQRDRPVDELERMEALRARVVEKISLEAMKEAVQPTTYAALVQQYQGIEQRLRRTKELPAIEKARSGERSNTQDRHARAKPSHARSGSGDRKGSSPTVSQRRQPARNKPEGGDSARTRKRSLSTIKCYECQEYGHYKGSPDCAKYVATNETRNRSKEKGKAKP